MAAAAAAAAIRRNPRLSFPRYHLSTQPNPSPSPPSSSKPKQKPISVVKLAIQSESDPDRIADLFQSSTQLPRFYSHRPIYQLTLHKLARSRRPDLIERILESQKSDPSAPKSEGFFMRIISLYSASGMLDHAVQTFDRIPDRTERSFCALLTAFLDNQRFDQVREEFNHLPKELGISPGVVSHNILLKALCENGEIDSARQVLDEMVKKGLLPDIISYNTVLNGYSKKGDEAGFAEILKEISTKGLEPNVVTYNCRIAAHCGKSESFKAEELLEVMVSKNVQPHATSFNTTIDGFCKEGDVGSAVRVFKRMRVMKRMNGKDGVSPTSDTYIVLIRSLVEKGEFGLGLEICKECLVRKFAPPFDVVKGLIDGLMKNCKIEEAKDVVEKMKVVVKGDAADAWKKLEGEFAL